MEFFLGIFIIIPLTLLGFLGSSVTLFWTLKLVGLPDNRYIRALQVTLLSFGLILLTALLLNLIGLIIPVLSQFLSLLAPFIIYLWLLQKFYRLSLASCFIVSLIQSIITTLLMLALFVGVLLPLGLGSALLRQ